MAVRRLRARFDVVYEGGGVVAVMDCGGENMSVTNDAEAVVKHLCASGELKPGDRLIYCDAEGRWSELVHSRGEFMCYAHVGGRTLAEALARVGRGG
jgi:hypothetical protein